MFGCFGGGRTRVSDPVDLSKPPVEYEVNTEPIERADGIPLRLALSERKAQRLMRGAILASNYTDKVDVTTVKAREALMAKHALNTLLGVIIATDLPAGLRIQRMREFDEAKEFLPHVVESYRRYKIMNPDLMRTDYVKFLYLVQDCMSPAIQDLLEVNIAKPVVTVKVWLKKCGAEALLSDPRLPHCITPVPKIKDRNKLNKALRYKDVLVDTLVKEYSSKAGCKPEKVEIAIRSLNDASCFSNDNVDSTEEMIQLLKKYFSPETPRDRSVDLSIKEGSEGSRLTHAHAMQFTFVLQSLTLWKNLSKRLFQLWIIAEDDLLDPENPYTFRATGQGHQRVQPAPHLYDGIKEVLRQTQKELGQWVGSEKIHLGDDQVPNAFHFIDKYAQVSRIIIPILRTIAAIEETIVEDSDKADYVKEVWGSTNAAQTAILADFFRHGFDGSGGDNMEDAGSCIDGRLTSAWHWCNDIRGKAYYPLFLLAGFNSFDGDLSL